MNAFSGGVLPHGAKTAVSLIGRRGVAGFDVSGIESKLSCDLLRPVGDEVGFGCVFHREDSIKLAVAEVSVLVIKTFCRIRNA